MSLLKASLWVSLLLNVWLYTNNKLYEEQNENIWIKSQKIQKEIVKFSTKVLTSIKEEISEDINLKSINQSTSNIINITNVYINNICNQSINIWLLEDREKYEYLTNLLLEEGLSNNSIKIIDKWINEYLKWKTVFTNWENITFTEKFINKNKDNFYKNITGYLYFLLEIESNGGKKTCKKSK